MGDLTAEQQTLAYRFAAIALPLDATECDPWEWHGAEDWRRYFLTREWDVFGLWVSVGGEQNHLGEVSRWLHVGGDDECDGSDRHQLIEALLDGGELLERLRYEDADSNAVPRTVGAAAITPYGISGRSSGLRQP